MFTMMIPILQRKFIVLLDTVQIALNLDLSHARCGWNITVCEIVLGGAISTLLCFRLTLLINFTKCCYETYNASLTCTPLEL